MGDFRNRPLGTGEIGTTGAYCNRPGVRRVQPDLRTGARLAAGSRGLQTIRGIGFSERPGG